MKDPRWEQHPYNYMRWHRLSGITGSDGQVIELLAASCCDGIPVIARWTLGQNGTWEVEAIDGESQAWCAVSPAEVDSGEECVPLFPPPIWSDGLEAALKGLESPKAWRHTLHCEEGQTMSRLSENPDHDFGLPGKDYSSEFHVTSTPLFTRESG